MPVERREELLLIDIIERCDAIAEAVGELTATELAADELRRSAALWSLTIIGEAAGRMPTVVKERHPHIAWSQVVANRNVLVHTYESVSPALLHHSLTVRVPELRQSILDILER